MKKNLYFLLIPTLLLSSCGANNVDSNTNSSNQNNSESISNSSANNSESFVSESSSSANDNTASNIESSSTEEEISESSESSSAEEEISYSVSEEIDADYDSTQNTIISLLDNSTTISNNNGKVSVINNVVTVSGAGTYTINGTLSNGQLKVEAGEADKVEFSLENANITCDYGAPIAAFTADKFAVSAKSGTTNTLTDNRISTNEYADLSNACLYAECDMDLKGKGALNVYSSYNNGIGTKDDLEIKNLTLYAKAVNNAIKGSDSLTILSGNITAISTQGDALKTSNSDISSKGNQKGTITINDGTLNLYAACDAIDAAYDAVITGGTINAYTDSYSPYSEAVSVTSKELIYFYAPSSLSTYKFSAYFENENGEMVWANSKEITSSAPGGRPGGGYSSGKTYSFVKPTDSTHITFYAYSSSMDVNSTEAYSYATERLSLPTSSDYFKVSKVSGTALTGSWSSYSSQPQKPGPGGMMDGNANKAEYSCKGIKADNEITISGGNITVQSYDDAIHSNNDATLENGASPLGNVTITGGSLTLSTKDDGIHADNILTISDSANISILESYEGLEGDTININGGIIRLASSDDGVNSMKQLNISGGLLYLNAGGDGIDSNGNVLMSGGVVFAQGPTNGGNGVLDFDGTFTFKGGFLLAIGCSGMNQKPTASTGTTAISQSISTSTSSYVEVKIDGQLIAIINVTKSNQNYCVLSFDQATYGSSYTISTTTSPSAELVDNIYYIA